MGLFSKTPSMKCPKCGFPVLPKHSFCPHCGNPLNEEAEQQIAQQQQDEESQHDHIEIVEGNAEDLGEAMANPEYYESIEDAMQDAGLTDVLIYYNEVLANIEDEDESGTQASSEDQQSDNDAKERQRGADENIDVNQDIHQQEMADREAQRSREGQQFDFDLDERRKDADEARGMNRDIHQQDIADREAQRGREGQQFDFDLEERRKDADETRGVNRDIHQQDMADREAARSQDIAEREAQRSREGQQFNFDLEERRKDADEARGVNRDIHQQEMADREAARRQDTADREAQRGREGKQFDFDLRRAEKKADQEIRQEEKNFDFDLEVRRQEKADEHVLRMEEHEMKMDAHQQDMADREAQRRMEELKMKGSIAMQNMQAMMDAKRAAKKDEFEAEERRLQTQKDMTAEQIMAAQIREMDAGAQAKFAESFSAGKDAAREREVAKEQAQIYEKMMGQMMDMAKTGMQVNAQIASGRIAEERSRADEYREEAHRTQERLDHTQDQSLKYTAQVTTATPAPQQEPVEEAIPLNTMWLREHGYNGSFNELAQQLANLGANISQDRDKDGNPVIVVRKLSSEQVLNVLANNGVQFN